MSAVTRIGRSDDRVCGHMVVDTGTAERIWRCANANTVERSLAQEVVARP